jgi:hypothetical protein
MTRLHFGLNIECHGVSNRHKNVSQIFESNHAVVLIFNRVRAGAVRFLSDHAVLNRHAADLDRLDDALEFAHVPSPDLIDCRAACRPVIRPAPGAAPSELPRLLGGGLRVPATPLEYVVFVLTMRSRVFLRAMNFDVNRRTYARRVSTLRILKAGFEPLSDQRDL